ncbi:tripeptide aminopeptidase [Cnuella takakiae]|uniref:Peptidase T n=1 Tax=Cnuella takakiae TaxID=1302690 RepID=A0A1M5B1M5_9BACT|nr:peptidase T [Cnuella takakiae]OLY93299.1 peptidase T [Cnuella takakiae]SHF36373.1 tripeptide aminopeptidase [Cnuella takakiae]
MFAGYPFSAASRLMRYVQIDTQSDPLSQSQPSTEKQKNLGALLADELQALGLTDAHLDEYGYVYATLPANTDKAVPVICFCSHVDTAPDASGTGVKPLLHEAYDGRDLVLPDDPAIVLRPTELPYLKTCIGQDIITASGTTLLGGDDKAGVAAIMDAVQYLVSHPEMQHGTIKVLFTPDEEVGRGTARVDLQKLGADLGYTLDGGDRGSLEDETFSADGVTLTIKGIITHPGDAKGKLVNALKIAGEILAALPKDSLSPETTEGKEGFIHPTRVDGLSEQCTLEFIIRDFVTAGLQEKENFLEGIVQEVLQQHPGATYQMKVTEQYRNMKEVLDLHPQIIANAKEAIQRAGLPLKMESIRGGTDGSRLSFMGLPCPNLFTGMQAIHSKREFISVQDLHKAVETIVHLVQVWEERS